MFSREPLISRGDRLKCQVVCIPCHKPTERVGPLTRLMLDFPQVKNLRYKSCMNSWRRWCVDPPVFLTRQRSPGAIGTCAYLLCSAPSQPRDAPDSELSADLRLIAVDNHSLINARVYTKKKTLEAVDQIMDHM